MPLVALDSVSIAFGHLPLLDDATMLQIIGGEVAPDTGTLWRQPALRVARLVQDVPLTATRPVSDVVAEGLHGLAGHDAEEWRRAHKVDLILSRLQLDGD